MVYCNYWQLAAILNCNKLSVHRRMRRKLRCGIQEGGPRAANPGNHHGTGDALKHCIPGNAFRGGVYDGTEQTTGDPDAGTRTAG
jgi:hypothetical protein